MSYQRNANYRHGTAEGLWRKPVPVSFCPPQVHYGQLWDRTRACVVRSWQIPPGIHYLTFVKMSSVFGKKTCYVPPMVFVQVQSCLIVRGIVLSWRNGDHVRFEQAPCLLLHIFLWIIKTGTRKTVFMPNTWWTFSEKWVREYSNLVVAPPVPLLNPFPTLEDLVRSKIF